MTSLKLRTGGRILIDQLQAQGVEHVFCVPGESYLAALDALHDSPIQVTICRQEGGAAMMAEAHGKLTGRPGICFVTRGPGATNASPGVHIARQDSTPMILFVGQIARGMRGREAFQELDYRAVFGSAAKWAVEIDDAARIPEIISRAFHAACSGRPGPVVVALPEDMLTETAAVGDARRVEIAEAAPAADDLARLADLLGKARRPAIIAGGSRWDQQAVDGLARFSERFELPVAVSFRRQSLFPASHPNFIGDIGVGANPKLVEFLRSSDLILLLGGRFSEMPSQGYTLLGIPVPSQTFVHVHPGAEELGRVYQPDLAFNVSPRAFIRALEKLSPAAPPERAPLVEAGRAAFLAWNGKPTSLPGAFNLGEAICALRERLPKDAVIANGAGNFATWVHRFYRFERFGTQLAPTSGSMGYGVPAAIGAARLNPRRPAIVIAGDGDFLMNGQEFATAVQYDLPVIVVVVDNGMFGTIRMHQEREYPGRVVGTALRNPDFAAYALAFGGHGERVERTEDFIPAFERASASRMPAIIHCITDPEALTPGRSLSEIRKTALERG
ncbi:MAG TPA: thiamine pyrophosphate-binding protein [Acetobacteraceae bacterium]|nr:thiamine pyrophosphate-binding protein [Acetobacteraceae bacterium]